MHSSAAAHLHVVSGGGIGGCFLRGARRHDNYGGGLRRFAGARRAGEAFRPLRRLVDTAFHLAFRRRPYLQSLAFPGGGRHGGIWGGLGSFLVNKHLWNRAAFA